MFQLRIMFKRWPPLICSADPYESTFNFTRSLLFHFPLWQPHRRANNVKDMLYDLPVYIIDNKGILGILTQVNILYLRYLQNIHQVLYLHINKALYRGSWHHDKYISTDFDVQFSCQQLTWLSLSLSLFLILKRNGQDNYSEIDKLTRVYIQGTINCPPCLMEWIPIPQWMSALQCLEYPFLNLWGAEWHASFSQGPLLLIDTLWPNMAWALLH